MTITRINYLVVYTLFIVCFPLSNTFSQNTQTTWKEQLEYLIGTPYEGNKGDICNLHLINYTYIGKIKNEIDKSRIIDSLLSYNAATLLHLPPLIVRDTVTTDSSCEIRTREFPMFNIIPIREVVEIYESMDKENPIIQTKQNLNKLIEIGFDFLELKWSYKNNIFYSICIVSNKNGGVVFDLIGSQISVKESFIINKY